MQKLAGFTRHKVDIHANNGVDNRDEYGQMTDDFQPLAGLISIPAAIGNVRRSRQFGGVATTEVVTEAALLETFYPQIEVGMRLITETGIVYEIQDVRNPQEEITSVLDLKRLS